MSKLLANETEKEVKTTTKRKSKTKLTNAQLTTKLSELDSKLTAANAEIDKAWKTKDKVSEAKLKLVKEKKDLVIALNKAEIKLDEKTKRLEGIIEILQDYLSFLSALGNITLMKFWMAGGIKRTKQLWTDLKALLSGNEELAGNSK